MSQIEHREVWILGAGLAGALLSCLLMRKGINVSVSERRSSVELEQLAAGRSINLALAERGRFALAQAGSMQRDQGLGLVVDEVLSQAIAMPGRQVHLMDGTENFQPYAADRQQAIYSVHRARMNRTLLRAANDARETSALHFDERVIRIDLRAKRAWVERDGQPFEISFGCVVGADGAGSVLRQAIAEATNTKPYFDTLDHGYKELHIPPNAQGDFALAPHALHIWPRETFMLIALPNPDHSFTATLFLQNEGERSFAAINTAEKAQAFFQHYFADVATHIPDAARQLIEHPQGILGTLRCPRWHFADVAILIGDAAHAIVPFHGQGMNCAFEDCVALAAAWGGLPRGDVFANFASQRQPQAHAIAEMALENYIEMRDLVADDDYRLRKALEQKLALRHSGLFVPRYELVSFTRYDYTLARARGQIQSQLLMQLCKEKTNLDQVDWNLADQLILAHLQPLPGLAGR